MLAVGRALVSKADLLLLDEPSLGLAPKFVTLIMQTVRRLCVDRGISVLLVEQNARSALSVSHHAVILNLGQIVVSDTAANVSADDGLRHHYLGF